MDTAQICRVRGCVEISPPDEIRRYMQMLKQSGSFTVEPETLEVIHKGFSAGRSEMAETAQTIGAVRRESGYLLDPHTATGVKVARAMPASASPMVVLSTAHPAKFPAAVRDASGIEPALPEWLGDLMKRKESFTVLPSDLRMLQDHISRHARAAR